MGQCRDASSHAQSARPGSERERGFLPGIIGAEDAGRRKDKSESQRQPESRFHLITASLRRAVIPEARFRNDTM